MSRKLLYKCGEGKWSLCYALYSSSVVDAVLYACGNYEHNEERNDDTAYLLPRMCYCCN